MQIPKQKQGQQEGDPKVYRGNKIKLDRLSKQDTAVLQAVAEQKGKLGKVDNYAIVEVEPHEGSPTQRNKVQLQHRTANGERNQAQRIQMQNPQLQGSQGAQLQSRPNAKREIALISLTTAKIDVREELEQPRSEQGEGPDDQA